MQDSDRDSTGNTNEFRAFVQENPRDKAADRSGRGTAVALGIVVAILVVAVVVVVAALAL